MLTPHSSNTAVTQILNDDFFQNPAQLSTIHHTQSTAGFVFINPQASFEGTVKEVNGSVRSNVQDTLPYLLTGYRINEHWVIGFNAVPSAYGHLEWPMDSFVSPVSTQTKIVYYRFGVQSSYEINTRWAVGAGFNVEDNARYFTNFAVPSRGNQVNSITDINYTGDLGLYYKINDTNYLSLAGYTQVNTYGQGTSSDILSINPNLSLNVTQAPVIYLGLQHQLTPKWFLSEKIYWSGWSIQHNINFTNTTSGTYIVPTNWKDVWSFQVTTRYAIKQRITVLSLLSYETNPVPLETNNIGYPLASAGYVSTGLDIALTKDFSLLGVYTYGAYLPNSPISNKNSNGIIHTRVQSMVLQVTYKM
ncbi:MAG: outer membrane protein transport protein [Legionella sp.]|uniref:OmpP1/FadL family transporter n=1 Tax=Legionella sp. TaxID=459 RepID=UPI0039E66F33